MMKLLQPRLKIAAKAQASKEASANKNIVGGSKAEGFARSLLEILERQKQRAE